MTSILPQFGIVLPGDLDQDHDVDLAIGRDFAAPVDLRANDGAGGFTARHAGVSIQGGYYTTGGAMVDLDGDALADVVYASYGFRPGGVWFGGLSVHRNRGYGGFDAGADGIPDSCQ